jgi:hypothetical protein
MRPQNRLTTLAWLVVTAGCASHGGRAATRSSAPSAREWHEAVNLLQADTSSGAFLDTLLVADVAAGLARIRARYPALRTMEVGPDRTYLVVNLDPAASLEVTRYAQDDHSQRALAAALRRSAVAAALDSLAHTYGVRQMDLSVRAPPWVQLRLYFQRPVHIGAVAAVYERVPHVRYAGPERYLGDGGGIGLVPEGAILRFYFVRKWGDCEAGCLFYRATPVTYDRRTGAVHKEPDEGDPLPTQPPNELLLLTGAWDSTR